MKIFRSALAAMLVFGFGAVQASNPVEAKEVNQTNSINYYETQCQKDVREAHRVPLLNEAHAQWQRDHLHTPEGRAYNADYAACPSPAKWDFDNMILVGTE